MVSVPASTFNKFLLKIEKKKVGKEEIEWFSFGTVFFYQSTSDFIDVGYQPIINRKLKENHIGVVF